MINPLQGPDPQHCSAYVDYRIINKFSFAMYNISREMCFKPKAKVTNCLERKDSSPSLKAARRRPRGTTSGGQAAFETERVRNGKDLIPTKSELAQPDEKKKRELSSTHRQPAWLGQAASRHPGKPYADCK